MKSKPIKKKQRLILHIGMHKCGSSAIQAKFQHYSNNNVRYLALNSPNHSGFARLMFMGNMSEHRLHKRDDLSIAELGRQRGVATAHFTNEMNERGQSVIISGEGFVILKPKQVEEMRGFFSAFFKDIDIYAYVRDPMGYSVSASHQELKAMKPGVSYFRYVDPQYKNKFQKYTQQFGRRNTHLRLFQPSDFPNRDVVLDFANWIGVPPPVGEKDVVNASLSLEAAAVLVYHLKSSAIDLSKHATVKTRRRFIDKLQVFGSQKFSLDPERLTDNICRDDLQWIEDRLGKKMPITPKPGLKTIGSDDDLLEIGKENIESFMVSIDEKMSAAAGKGSPLDPFIRKTLTEENEPLASFP